MISKIWVLPVTMLAAGTAYIACWDFFFPSGYADNLVLVFLPAFLLTVLTGAVLRRFCNRREAFWGALILSGYNAAIYSLQVYLSRHLFEFGIRWLPLTGPLTVPNAIFKQPLHVFLYDVLSEGVAVALTYPIGWAVCFAPLFYVLVCKKPMKESGEANENRTQM